MNTQQQLQFKQQLKSVCISLLEQRLEGALDAMKNAQESANNEDKSTVGDKHETTRAMSHLDNEMNAKQMEEARHDLTLLHTIDVSKIYSKAERGAVIVCKHAMFFISAGLGTQTVDDQKIIFISTKAPLAIHFNGKKAGEHFLYNKVEFEIVEVF
ncbi:MAG: hypothetical protein ABI723_10310 [Bacteroidia bacterium]